MLLDHARERGGRDRFQYGLVSAMAMTDEERQAAVAEIEATIERLRDFKPRSHEETILRTLEEEQRARPAAPAPVRKEAPNTGLVYKTREVVETASAAASDEPWWQWVDKRIEAANEAILEATGEVIGHERERERDAIKSAVDRLDKDLGRSIAVNQGKAEGRLNAIENQLEREVREMQQRVDRAEKAMADARMELLNLASEFRAILNDAAEAQRQISLALLHR